MGRRCLLALWVLVLLFVPACMSGETASPDPRELSAAMEEQLSLPELVDMTGEYLEMGVGIQASSYDSAVYYLPADGTLPDEIAIIRAVDSRQADAIQSALEERLAYKEKSAQNYLTENLPVIQRGVIRRDGLTISLIVSEQVEEIEELFDSMGG